MENYTLSRRFLSRRERLRIKRRKFIITLSIIFFILLITLFLIL